MQYAMRVCGAWGVLALLFGSIAAAAEVRLLETTDLLQGNPLRDYLAKVRTKEKSP